MKTKQIILLSLQNLNYLLHGQEEQSPKECNSGGYFINADQEQGEQMWCLTEEDVLIQEGISQTGTRRS